MSGAGAAIARCALFALWAPLACQPDSLLRDRVADDDGGPSEAGWDAADRIDASASPDRSVAVDGGPGDRGSTADRTLAPDRTVGTDQRGVDNRGPGDSGASTGVDPSNGSGGAIAPGQTGDWSVAFGSGHVYVYLPTSYQPAQRAAPVVWLFNEEIAQWRAIADQHGIVLIDLDEYNDSTAYVQKINGVQSQLESQYNVDRARYHLAGWSAGGNLVVMLGSQNQDFAASTLVFPGTGGQSAYNDLAAWSGHKIRLYYACGDQDPNYSWSVVENEANAFAGLGYTTRFDKIVGCSHFIDEATHHVRSAAWSWVAGFNLRN